jgi:hypothetical protein
VSPRSLSLEFAREPPVAPARLFFSAKPVSLSAAPQLAGRGRALACPLQRLRHARRPRREARIPSRPPGFASKPRGRSRRFPSLFVLTGGVPHRATRLFRSGYYRAASAAAQACSPLKTHLSLHPSPLANIRRSKASFQGRMSLQGKRPRSARLSKDLWSSGRRPDIIGLLGGPGADEGTMSETLRLMEYEVRLAALADRDGKGDARG